MLHKPTIGMLPDPLLSKRGSGYEIRVPSLILHWCVYVCVHTHRWRILEWLGIWMKAHTMFLMEA